MTNDNGGHPKNPTSYGASIRQGTGLCCLFNFKTHVVRATLPFNPKLKRDQGY